MLYLPNTSADTDDLAYGFGLVPIAMTGRSPTSSPSESDDDEFSIFFLAAILAFMFGSVNDYLRIASSAASLADIPLPSSFNLS